MKKKITFGILGALALLHFIIGMWWLASGFILAMVVYWVIETNQPAVVALRNKGLLIYPLVIIGTLLLAICTRVLVFGLYEIPSGSMERTIIPGDLVWVNKLIYGPQLPSNVYEIPWINIVAWLTEEPDTDREKATWPYRRLKGYSCPKPGDVVVFNHPFNKTVFIKRCVATPGDTLQIIDGTVWVNGAILKEPRHAVYYSRVSYNDHAKARQVIDSLQIKMYGNRQKDFFNGHLSKFETRQLSANPAILSARIESERPDTAWRVYPRDKHFKWNIDNYGPYVLPRAGMTIELNDHNFHLYRPLIKRLEKRNIRKSKDHFQVDGEKVLSYKFKQNYYFMMGDNRHDSKDSRYFGPVPERDITGKATNVIFSTNSGVKWYERLMMDL